MGGSLEPFVPGVSGRSEASEHVTTGWPRGLVRCTGRVGGVQKKNPSKETVKGRF